MKGDKSQIALIILGTITTALFGVFFYRELFPEYRIYQNKYIEMEDFRASISLDVPPAFATGVKQIVLERADKGPAKVERCISCHVALKISDFSKTKVLYDESGKAVFAENGTPVTVENEKYIWKQLDDQIAILQSKGNTKEAAKLSELKVARVGEYLYDVTKVLSQHPLIGRETRPFESHPMEEYGCVICHNGNGQGLVTDRAHGPVFDETYEIEEEGFKPQFLEKDEKNDPSFSRVFNDKPGHRLLFQVNPLYTGALIQANCVNCHLPVKEPIKVEGSEAVHKRFNPDLLTKNYQRGEELYIAEACYACHRISGKARGGVGPELTLEGHSYPWFVKQSIVWPQADLKTSTMPNYRLDHEELQDLTTFLLAQKGEKAALSGIEYKNMIARWDAGEKQKWETPVSAADIQNVDYGLTLFATEGCAACHRLNGFESEVVYKSPQESIQESTWFQNLFDENILGSQIAKIINNNGPLIDEHLSSNPKESASLLEQLEKDHPGLIASFYSPFKFAARVNPDPKYQERLHKVLMMFIQEYGFGRQIGPKLNWAGVYRSDQWLMDHFRNPQSKIPRSIMPVFPFDETKFYALTHTLDAIGRKNTDQLRKLWEVEGFKPELAYQYHCAQCHGKFLEGNGPVAEWIYPIPKNLARGEFLRNLTKEEVRKSILHGVEGTPMPPWGEVGMGKKGKAVLSEKEIEQLTNWLFNFLPGREVIKDKEDVPKWQYEPEDVIEELRREGNELQSSSFFRLPTGYVAAANSSQTMESKREVTVETLFDKVEDPKQGISQYFIKKEYYTPENIEAGRHFFYENCAACHGKEADGSGLRSEAMFDAKPRMLTNINWLDSRDDLRLIRSIKYGVPGTSMSPWGDLTNSKLRLQLVLFIRSLSEAANLRVKLQNALYTAYDDNDVFIETLRAKPAAKMIALKKQLVEVEKQAENNPTEATIKAVLEKKIALKKATELDHQFQELRNLFKADKEIYQSLGQQILTLDHPDDLLNLTIQIIDLHQGKLSLDDEKVIFINSAENNKKINLLENELEEAFKKRILIIEQELTRLAALEENAVTISLIKDLTAKKKTLEKLMIRGRENFKKSSQLNEQQQKLIESLDKSL